MSYLQSQYTKNNAIGKTIADIEGDDGHGVFKIVFTDGTYLQLQPHVTEIVKKSSVTISQIVCSAFHEDGSVIKAKENE